LKSSHVLLILLITCWQHRQACRSWKSRIEGSLRSQRSNFNLTASWAISLEHQTESPLLLLLCLNFNSSNSPLHVEQKAMYISLVVKRVARVEGKAIYISLVLKECCPGGTESNIHWKYYQDDSGWHDTSWGSSSAWDWALLEMRHFKPAYMTFYLQRTKWLTRTSQYQEYIISESTTVVCRIVKCLPLTSDKLATWGNSKGYGKYFPWQKTYFLSAIWH